MHADSFEQIEDLQEKYKHLNPPKNYRPVKPRCCATCRLLFMADGSCHCIRPDGPDFDAGDLLYWGYVCDYWQDEDKE